MSEYTDPRVFDDKLRRRLLVTGGAGFVGSHLCDRLLARGDEVICLDNYRSGHPRNIAHLLNNPGFNLIVHDIVQPLPFDSIGNVDGIFNLACPASPPDYQRNPIETFKISVWGAINVLELGRRYDIPVLHASTSEVYGDPEIHPQPELYCGNVNPVGPRACYDEGKRGAETLFYDYRRIHGTQIRVARIFNTYGPRMRPNDGRVVSNFIVQALTGQDLTVYGNGSQTRSFCFVDDLVEGLLRLMDCPDASDRPVNLGNPGEFTVSDLASLVLAATKSSGEIVRRPLPVDDPTQRCPDITTAKELLGWAPTVALEEGLGRTIAYFDALLSGEEEVVPGEAAMGAPVLTAEGVGR